ncbi:MAG TPA: response regulator [Gemmatimonadales bacterium]
MARILIVEDSPDNMTLFQAVLRLAGHEVIGLMDGGEMVTTVASTRPDAVLLDIQLPDRDGFALLQEIRSRRDLRDLPVVALTAHAMAGDEEKALESGVSGDITQPINVREFARQVEGFLPRLGTGLA